MSWRESTKKINKYKQQKRNNSFAAQKNAPQFRSAHRLFTIYWPVIWFVFLSSFLRPSSIQQKSLPLFVMVRRTEKLAIRIRSSSTSSKIEWHHQTLLSQKKSYAVHQNAIENSWAHTPSACWGISEIPRSFSFSGDSSDAASSLYFATIRRNSFSFYGRIEWNNLSVSKMCSAA